MTRRSANRRTATAGSWTYRARRVFHGPLEAAGLFAVSRWALGLLALAVVATYTVAWTECVVSPNPPGAVARSRWEQGPLEAITVTGSEPGIEHVWWSDTYGWPFRSVGAVFEQINYSSGRVGTVGLRWGIVLGPPRTVSQGGPAVEWALPLLPVNGLFALNVAFYFALGGTVAIGVLVRRDRKRAAMRRCVDCSYPLGESERCPECGKMA